ncbi:hypothetical protein IQ276_027005 [Desmonostoc muscorum LEGE 12446]|uniref:Uncharacterized protein n=1 Tax=Desmonostoc muscorum LEGE 12446 TaxID=1828758 RepID=A0A8J6ZUC4_DESMC|nr:hypothetical protein [Desmonostoc muscorum]MCF2150016.1 hypothetical protein [Desmonostoc muscorum LEGE 12446]
MNHELESPTVHGGEYVKYLLVYPIWPCLRQAHLRSYNNDRNWENFANRIHQIITKVESFKGQLIELYLAKNDVEPYLFIIYKLSNLHDASKIVTPQ